MSYQVLARKWRPKTFSDVVGQEPVLAALANGLRQHRLHHAYLFSGTRGVGKTSIARLFAKGLNCINNGITADPCGECEHCKAIEEGHFIDLIEIDAASRTKVEDTRELLDNVQYKPVQGRYKVYLIDEVHMLSRHSFNALLKTLEEPPEYVKFLLATTDPQKLPITILSRCMQFHLKALEQAQISRHLEYILSQEHIPFEHLALEKLAKAAQGSIRDSLSLTDQAIAMSNGNIRLDIVNTMLGLLDDSQPIDILYALQQGNGESLMNALQSVAEQGSDWDELLGAIAENLHKIAMLQLLPTPQQSEDSHLDFLAKHIAPEDVQFFYQIIISGRKELFLAPSPRIGAEMTLLRALAFHPKFLTATQNKHSNVQSAVETSPKYVDMPVLSQTIKANYAAQPKSSGAGVDKFSPLSADSSLSGLAALDALNHLQQLEESEKQQHRQEQSKMVAETLAKISAETAPKMTELPVREMTPPKKRQPLSTSVSSKRLQAQLEKVQNSQQDKAELEEEEQELAQVDYQWEWRNPELAKVDTGIRPSEIKLAILNQTPELKNKILAIVRQKDQWADIVERSGIGGFTRELALNCFILEQNESQMILGIHSKYHYLQQEQNLNNLAEALERLYEKPITLQIKQDDREILTPALYQQNVYQELRQQAQQALQNDAKIRLLQKELAAKLDLESIQPV
ncbi:DNA polymerase III subunit gamma/tau [Rodentibacter caecimuris]|uniref:DNA polymerase III subunit gamma/tau n=1 Tax=Rodentibacter caecimuris TaxID=1796644 RepID=A0ABX3KWE7_9PAST|nr:DNA polymerase III subunit gamma/tau [Rodentibacter heylii]